MHAVVVRVEIEDFEAARRRLREEVVPRASQAPGFVAGYWTRTEDGDKGLAMLVFESEEAARAAEEAIQAGTSAPGIVTLRGVSVREVVEHA
jgi:hypothetical protein